MEGGEPRERETQREGPGQCPCVRRRPSAARHRRSVSAAIASSSPQFLRLPILPALPTPPILHRSPPQLLFKPRLAGFGAGLCLQRAFQLRDSHPCFNILSSAKKSEAVACGSWRGSMLNFRNWTVVVLWCLAFSFSGSTKLCMKIVWNCVKYETVMEGGGVRLLCNHLELLFLVTWVVYCLGIGCLICNYLGVFLGSSSNGRHGCDFGRYGCNCGREFLFFWFEAGCSSFLVAELIRLGGVFMLAWIGLHSLLLLRSMVRFLGM